MGGSRLNWDRHNAQNTAARNRQEERQGEASAIAMIAQGNRELARNSDLDLVMRVLSQGWLSDRARDRWVATRDWMLGGERRVLSDKQRDQGKSLLVKGFLQRVGAPELPPDRPKRRLSLPRHEVLHRIAKANVAEEQAVVRALSPWLRDPSLLPKAPPGRK